MVSNAADGQPAMLVLLDLSSRDILMVSTTASRAISVLWDGLKPDRDVQQIIVL